ncbi:MAG: hypothetical protein HYS25_14070 [Ignavibacteriales bacterium]|nr:hypothetical protein [Ignavibacteriales bacterium]
MSIDEYFESIDILLNNPLFIKIEIKKEKKSINTALLVGKITLSNFSEFHFMEYIESDSRTAVVTYRYHYQTKNKELIFRYDNAPHHEEIKTFPHHKHTATKVIDTKQKTLSEVIEEILLLNR